MADFWETLNRWLSRRHVAGAKPSSTLLVRRGYFKRDYMPWSGHDVHATINSQGKPYRAEFVPATEWAEVDGVLSTEVDQSMDNNGIATCNLEIENVRLEAVGTPGSFFHKFARGYLSPWRGFRKPDQPENEWTKVFGKRAQFALMQGYGSDQEFPVCVGWINDVDQTSQPDRVTAVGRDAGQILTTERLAGHVKDPALPDPITFMDRKHGEERKKVGYKARASSEENIGGPFHARNVCDSSRNTVWWSREYDDPHHTEYVQIHIPRGKYTSFYLEPDYDGMKVYVSVFARDIDPGTPDLNPRNPKYRKRKRAKIDGQPVEDGWIDLGKGNVPGIPDIDFGWGEGNGYPWMKTGHANGPGKTWYFGHELDLGKDSVIRIAFRNLGKTNARHGHKRRAYRAGVKRLFGIQRKVKPEVKKHRTILVDDLSDIVKVILRWGGFDEWEVENTGVRLKAPMKFNQATYLIDVINKIKEMTNYVFFIKPPLTLESESIGVPVFRYNRVLDTTRQEFEQTPMIRDDQLLTALQVKETDEVLPSYIRIRGKQRPVTKHGRGDQRDRGRPRDRPPAGNWFTAAYTPPWARRDQIAAGWLRKTRMDASIVQRIQHAEPLYRSNFECKVAAILTALAATLKQRVGTFEMPAMPFLTLDYKIAVWDEGTATHARIYVLQRTISYRSGQDASWTMSVGGAMLDSPDMVTVVEDLYQTIAAGDPKKPTKQTGGSSVSGTGTGQGTGSTGWITPRLLIPGSEEDDG
jgi:hypothetical protein